MKIVHGQIRTLFLKSHEKVKLPHYYCGQQKKCEWKKLAGGIAYLHVYRRNLLCVISGWRIEPWKTDRQRVAEVTARIMLGVRVELSI